MGISTRSQYVLIDNTHAIAHEYIVVSDPYVFYDDCQRARRTTNNRSITRGRFFAIQPITDGVFHIGLSRHAQWRPVAEFQIAEPGATSC
jgi:hypothetical protein